MYLHCGNMLIHLVKTSVSQLALKFLQIMKDRVCICWTTFLVNVNVQEPRTFYIAQANVIDVFTRN